jgi:hypothetical protein
MATLTDAARGSSTSDNVLRWQLEGQLHKTCLVGNEARLDRFRFCPREINSVRYANSEQGAVLSPTQMAHLLRVSLNAVSKLSLASEDGPHLRTCLAADEGKSTEERYSPIEVHRFQQNWLSSRAVAELLNISCLDTVRYLETYGVNPVSPSTGGSMHFWKTREIDAVISQNGEF